MSPRKTEPGSTSLFSSRNIPPRRTKSVLSSLSPTFTFDERPASRFPNSIWLSFNTIESDEVAILEALYAKYKDSAYSLRKSDGVGCYELLMKEGVRLSGIVEEGFTYKGCKVPMSLTMRPYENVLMVTILNVPCAPERELACVLEEELLKYGHLADLRLVYYPMTDWLESYAFAFYDLSRSPNVADILPKKITFPNQFAPTKLVWTHASMHCYICSKDGHTSATCPTFANK
ncbi:hypothetical protein BDF22DRAFT_658314 [Syncephalis plumigaleata]|nr:hypothetical protein BDF22DRAFT_658314 [Syncephalis plumigaleata]